MKQFQKIAGSAVMLSIFGVLGGLGNLEKQAITFFSSNALIRTEVNINGSRMSDKILAPSERRSHRINHKSEVVQTPSVTPNGIDQEILAEISQCVLTAVPTPQEVSLDVLQAASIQCVFKVVILAPDGTVRRDASDRLTALVRSTGVSFPQPIRQGQATVQLQVLPDAKVFTIPVVINGKTRNFLFDTGASNSIIETQIAEELGLTGTLLPNDLLAYFVVGDNCSQVNATLLPLPTLAVESATAEGMTGMALPKTAIPGGLAGVLGLDFLSGFDVLLNPQTQQLQLLPPSTPVSDGIPLQGKLGVMTVQVEINHQGPFTFLLDTGAEIMVVSQDLAQQLSLPSDPPKEIQVRGFCGTENAKLTQLEQVKLQNYEAINLDTAILENELFNLLGIDGIIGQNFLNRYQQHWRFGAANELGFPETGSLSLSEL